MLRTGFPQAAAERGFLRARRHQARAGAPAGGPRAGSALLLSLAMAQLTVVLDST